MQSMASSSALTGAHTATLGAAEKGAAPSLFDVLAQESLTTSLRPAANFLFKVLARMNPDRWGGCSRWSEELFALFDLLLQQHYLKNYGASFSENFYGMKRVVMTSHRFAALGGTRLRSILLLVAWPYFKGKLEALHERITEQLQYLTPRSDEPVGLKLKRIFLKLWPWLKTIFSALGFLMQLSYAMNWSSTHSPAQWASGTRLERLMPQDLAAFEMQPLHHAAGILPRLWRFVVSMPGVLSRLFGYSLFLLQFIDLFYNSDLGAQLAKQTGMGRTPKAPHKLLSEEEVMGLETSKCPICLCKRVNDTALTCSGYVFCFACIDTYIKRESRCPVTGLPATSASLVRIFTAPS
ncbi:prx-12 [Pristionchus pacificus]|uniref:Peroxisome assembly protein 12 n=1 Tax=Pristionchus pacificus TaxID=54126 RepID=A0A8R1V2E8_PRIPA|nr:prx-12 [Pristionchus pacificus]